ncbi:OLC1v1035532C1 [Oldenlandia corymbosa var. corymbosa]|uniref:OLC1v1035532C1 n=1 Tax=Oldenlandia corymbosa var. corymbosa TaxID=529605 RepID=A0AAV1CT75_OLDCO|nr:OLC1v1035532C1 [Oldenlandia corymbosa var. corymbosa]
MVAGRPGNIKHGAFQAPPPPGQQTMNAAGVATPITGQPTAGPGGVAHQANIPTAQHSSEVLGQTRKLGVSPARMAVGGVAVIMTLAYFTLYSHKKPEASALDVARVSSGTASPQNTRPRD